MEDRRAPAARAERHPDDGLPQWLIDEVESAHALDPAVALPTDLRSQSCDGKRCLGARLFAELNGEWPADVSHVLVSDGRRQDGLSGVIREHARALSRGGATRVAVVLTGGSRARDLGGLPEGTHVTELGVRAKDLPRADQEAVLFRLLCQAGPAVIHQLESELLARVLSTRARALAARSALVASVRNVAHLDALSDALPSLQAVLCDTHACARAVTERYGLPRELVHVVQLPAPGVPRVWRQRPSGDRLAVIVVANPADTTLVAQLIEASAGLPLSFHVWGLSDDRTIRRGDAQYYGRGDEWVDLPLSRYDVAVWPRCHDPYLLLGVVRTGLICVTERSEVAAELLGERGGMLVDHPDGYVDALRLIWSRRRHLDAMRLAARDQLDAVHSPGVFARRLAGVPAYGLAAPPVVRTTTKQDVGSSS